MGEGVSFLEAELSSQPKEGRVCMMKTLVHCCDHEETDKRVCAVHPMADESSSVVPRASKTTSSFGRLSPVKVLENP